MDVEDLAPPGLLLCAPPLGGPPYQLVGRQSRVLHHMEHWLTVAELWVSVETDGAADAAPSVALHLGSKHSGRVAPPLFPTGL